MNDKDNLKIALSAFEKSLPVWRELLAIMDENDGYIPLKKDLLNAIPNTQVLNWAHSYESPVLLKDLALEQLIHEQNLNEIEDNTKKSDTEFMNSLAEYLPFVFQFQAVMFKGCTMTRLVTKAKLGDDKAFCHAVQIDRTVLYGIPYFSNRLCQIQLSNDHQFRQQLANAINGKIKGKRPKHPLLWYLLAFLDDIGLSKVPLSYLMKFCEQQEIYGLDEKHSNESLKNIRDKFNKKQVAQI